MNNNVHRKNGTQKTCKYENPVILQVDGNNSSVNSANDDDEDSLAEDSSDESNTSYDTDDEAHPYITPANLSPVSGQDVVHGQPLLFVSGSELLKRLQ